MHSQSSSLRRLWENKTKHLFELPFLLLTIQCKMILKSPFCYSVQEHRNMPMQDAMVLVAHNYDTFKIENRAKERDEISRKAAKMADEVLMREHDRQGHPVSVLTAITLLSEGRYGHTHARGIINTSKYAQGAVQVWISFLCVCARTCMKMCIILIALHFVFFPCPRFLTPQELTVLINYLQDKRDRVVRGSTDPHLGKFFLSDFRWIHSLSTLLRTPAHSRSYCI